MGHSSIYHENKLMTGLCILGVVYLALSLHCYRRLLYLQKHSSELNTRKLFVMSCFLCCVLRVMSFTSIVVLNFGYINVDDTLNSEDEDTFLGAAMLVLMDFPNYVIISAYMLLAVVWAEAFLQSLLTSLLYGAMTVINIFLPSTWFALYVYMSIKFAGFPPASKSATERLRALTKLGMVWTVSRLSWGAISLSEVTDEWLFGNRSSAVLLSIELLLVFFVVEIIPICMSLHIAYLQALATSDFSPTVQPRCEEAPSLYTNFHDSGTPLYRDINTHGYSFDGDDDLQRIIFTDSLSGRNNSNSSNESSSPVSRGGSDYSGKGSAHTSGSRKSRGTLTTGTVTDPGSNRPSHASGTSGSSGFGSARNTLASRDTTHTSSTSLADSEASEQEYAPSGEHTGGGWFSGWFHG